MSEILNDELKIYRGEDFHLSDYITLHQTSLGEICDYGESNYFSMIYNITATPQSLKGQLWKKGIDYTTLTPYQLFWNLLYKTYPVERTKIIFGDFDFTKFTPKNYKNEVVLVQKIGGEQVIFDEVLYNIMIDYICKSHFIKRDLKMPGNEKTKTVLIEDALEEMEAAQNAEKKSMLKNLISAMVNSPGFKYNHEQVWDMKIYAFMDSVKRIGKIKESDLILQSGYSGFGIDLSKLKNKEKITNWLGELDY